MGKEEKHSNKFGFRDPKVCNFITMAPAKSASSATPASASMNPMEKRCRMRDLNENITCKICHGYLVDATTVTECLHTFCKSCIVKHLEDSNTCPECDDLIHQSHPLDYIAFDRTMQDLVYKIVPDLEKDEYDSERKFYANRGLPCPKDQIAEESEEAAKEDKMTPDANTNMDFHRFDEQVSLLLECKESSVVSSSPVPSSSTSTTATVAAAAGSPSKSPEDVGLKRKYIRCSSLATVTHLKKFIAKKLLTSADKYKDVEITCNDELLYKDHTLKFVYVTRWRTKDPPLKLTFTTNKKTSAETTKVKSE